MSTQIRNATGIITNAEQIETWCQQDVDARTYLYSTINTEQQNSLLGCNTASTMWARIQTEYVQIAADNEHLVMTRFFNYKYQQGNTIMAHIAAIEQMASQLRDLQAPVSDVQVMSKILLTLPPSYRHFLSTWRENEGSNPKIAGSSPVTIIITVSNQLYLSVMSRPDIAYAMGQAAKYSANPGPGQWSVIKRILAYLAGTRNHSLCDQIGVKDCPV